MPDIIKELRTWLPNGSLDHYVRKVLSTSTPQSGLIKTSDVLNKTSAGFDVSHLTRTPGFSIDGAVDANNPDWSYSYHDWSEANRNLGFGDHIFPRLEDEALNDHASRFLTRTNPSRPDVSLPVFLGEFRDLPSQIYDEGRKALRDNSRIGVKFGILPMASDVMKLMRLSEYTDKRMKMLKRLYKPPKPGRQAGMRLRKKIFTRQKRLLLDRNYILDTGHYTTGHAVGIERMWGSTRWVPNTSYSVPSLESDLRDEAKRLIIDLGSQKGISGYAADVWELLPWSWFADWFGNFSDHIDQHMNQAVASSSGVWLMKYRRAEQIVSHSEGGSQTQSLIAESKQRVWVQPHFEMTMPLLSNSQVSILTDIITSKRYAPSRRKRVGLIPPSNPH